MKWSELTIRERDALVAKHILGCRVGLLGNMDRAICNCEGRPHMGIRCLSEYTSDWSGMEAVVKAMRRKGYGIGLSLHTDGSNGVNISWWVDYQLKGEAMEHSWPLPELVAYVCLKVLGVDVEE